MKARFYVDVEVDEKQFLSDPLLGKHEENPDPESAETDAHFESMRYLSWVLSEYLEAKKPVGYEGPEIFIKELHAEYVYPDPAGSIVFGEEEDEDGFPNDRTERPEGSLEQCSTSDSHPAESQ